MRPLHNAKNSASNQGTGQNDGKKRIDSAVQAFPFSRCAVFPFRHVVVNGWKSFEG